MQTITNQVSDARALALIAAAEVEIDRLHDLINSDHARFYPDTDTALRLRATKLQCLRRDLSLNVTYYGLPVRAEDFWALFDLLYNVGQEVAK